MKLTYYMFKESVDDFQNTVIPEKFNSYDGYKEINIKVDIPFQAKAYLQKNRENEPIWLPFFKDYVDFDADISNSSNSFLVIIKTKERYFAITTGYGFTAINRSVIENEFGLKVVLNEVNPEKIKFINSRNFDTNTKMKKIFHALNTELYEFDFDVNEDLLSGLSGMPENSLFGNNLIGSDSLSMDIKIEFTDLGKICDELYKSFIKENYKKNFEFVDKLNIIRDEELINKLDKELINSFFKKEENKFCITYPEIPEYTLIDHFKIYQNRNSIDISEVDLDSIYSFFNQFPDVNQDLQKTYIVGKDCNKEVAYKKYSLFDYIVFETSLQNRRFIYSANHWFEIADSLIHEVEKSLQSIKELETGFLPPMREGQSEREYNKSVADKNEKIVLFDAENYPIIGYSKVEVCDLLTENNEFICVKKYSSSSTLSHLYSQGYISARFLIDDTRYRKFIVDKCIEKFSDLAFTEEVIKDNKEIKYIYAIVSKDNRPLIESLPFFSKINLLNANKIIRRLGFQVLLCRIDYSSA